MNKKCIINFLQAGAGDCFLLELPDKNCILIDCGYKSTYYSELKPLLMNLSRDGYRIALLVVTHTDEDHIGGAISLLEDNKDCQHPEIIPIDNIWFNGIFQICKNYLELASHIHDELEKQESEKFRFLLAQFQKLINVGNSPISANQAESFESLCEEYHYPLNRGSNNGLLLEGSLMEIGACKVKVLSPSNKELRLFANWIDRELIQLLGKGYSIKKDKFIAFLENMVMAVCKDEIGTTGSWKISCGTPNIDEWIGTSSLASMNEANRASIVLEIECFGKRMLFMGDSESGDWISKSYDRYDLVKISHHGTTKPNIHLLEKTVCDKVLISTNGKRNNHPEDDLLARVIKSGSKEIYFNYDIRRKNDLLAIQGKYGFSVFFEEKQIVIV